MRTYLKPMLVLLSIAVISAAAQAADPARPPSRDRATYEEVAALLTQEANMRNEIDNNTATIRSEADLKSYLQSTPIVRTPLGNLSSSAQRQFLASLTFNEKGLTGFNYRALSDELSVSEIYQVLGLFGMQRTTALIPDARIETSLDEAILRHISPQACPPRGPKIRGSELSPQLHCDGDRKEFRCISPGTCESRNTFICTSNC